MMRDIDYRILLLLGVLFMAFFMGCGSSEGTQVVKRDQERPDWEAMVDSGKVGKADFINEEMENLDSWPYPLNEQEVIEKVVYNKDPRYVNTCSRFLNKHEKKYRIHAEFVIEPTGDLNYIYFRNETGACKDIAEDILKNLKFAPGVKDSKYVRTYVIYPLDLLFE